MSVFGNTTGFGNNNFFENVQFRGEINNALGNVDYGMGTVQIRAALDSVDMRNLSTQEKNTLIAAVDVLGADGEITPREAKVITDMIDRFESSDQFIDTLTGGNSGSLIGSSQSFLPFTPASLSQFPGNALFGNVLGSLVDKVVQTFKDSLFSATANAMLEGCEKSTYANDKVAKALENADLSKFNPAERAKVLSMIGFATADGRVGLVEARAICQYIDEVQGKNCGCKGEWTVDQRDNGTATIDLGNYTLDLKENNSEFVVTNKETGEKTRIWGDPHFEHNGSHVGDFYGTTTLNLADGTKITINTTPYEAGGNGTTLSSTLTITQGDRAMRVTGLDQNQLGDLKIQQVNGVGRLVDAAVDDGVQIYENPEDGPWLRLNAGGWMQAIDGDFLSKIV